MGIILKTINISLTPQGWVSQINVHACTIDLCLNVITDKVCTKYFGKLCNILVTFVLFVKNHCTTTWLCNKIFLFYTGSSMFIAK